MPKPTPWQERFWLYVEKGARDECWEWIGTTTPEGHGRLHVGGRPVSAHRLSLKMQGVEIPKGFHVHHICENPPCVNPEHLEVVSPADHKRRHRRTHCRQGHLLAETVVSDNDRRCLTCINEGRRRRRKAKGRRTEPSYERHLAIARERRSEARTPLLAALASLTTDGSFATAAALAEQVGWHRMSVGRSLAAAYREGQVERRNIGSGRYGWRPR